MIIISLIRLFITVYTLILIAYIILSWFPSVRRSKIFHFLQFYSDPYLRLFRKIIPPIGGIVDLSPLLAFISLQVIEYLLIKLALMFL